MGNELLPVIITTIATGAAVAVILLVGLIVVARNMNRCRDASEARMIARLDLSERRTIARLDQLEQRMIARLDQFEQRTIARLNLFEQRVIARLDSVLLR